jgi:hypothetical protein
MMAAFTHKRKTFLLSFTVSTPLPSPKNFHHGGTEKMGERLRRFSGEISPAKIDAMLELGGEEGTHVISSPHIHTSSEFPGMNMPKF